MDKRLEEKLEKWHSTIESLKKAEFQFLTLEANEKPLWSKLFLETTGKTIAEREALTYTHSDWLSFSRGLSEAKAQTNHEKRVLELRQAVFNGSYLEYKLQGEVIQKYPKGIT